MRSKGLRRVRCRGSWNRERMSAMQDFDPEEMGRRNRLDVVTKEEITSFCRGFERFRGSVVTH